MRGFCSILVIALTLPSCIESKYGTDCATPDNEPGSCMPIKSCASALQMARELQHGRGLQHEQYLRNSFCGSVGTVAYVCCAEAEVQEHSSNVTKHLEKVDCGNTAWKKVAHGHCAEPFDYRWMALLVYEGRHKLLCDGTLIDDRHVLTAAHCLYNNTLLPVAVRLGEYNLTTQVDCVQFGDVEVCLDPVVEIPIEEILPHEHYIYKQRDHDIALIRLKESVQCKTTVRPICLPITEKLQTNLVEYFDVAGWGITEAKSRPDCLKYATVPNRPQRLCEDAFGVQLNDGHICAGGKKFQDICYGDSGGPLFHHSTYVDNVSRAIQYGVVSHGSKTEFCGERNLPAVYTNVTHYMQWILDHMVLSESPADSNCYRAIFSD